MSSCDEETHSIPVSINANELNDGIVVRGDSEIGTARRKIDYAWRVFAGHGAESMRLHFPSISINGANSFLVLLDAEGNELARFESRTESDYWTPTYKVNQIDIRLFVDSETGDDFDRFSIDRIEFTMDPVRLLFLNPLNEVIVSDERPNVNYLQGNNSLAGTNMNRESYGVIAPGDTHFALVNGSPWRKWDFATTGSGTGAPTNFVEDRDVWYTQDIQSVVKGRFGSRWPEGDDYDDVVVVTRDGEVFLSINRDSYDFYGYHLAHRDINPQPSETVYSGLINGDDTEDLLLISDTTVRYFLNDNSQSYPQFLNEQSVSLPWNPSTLIGYHVISKFVTDFNGDDWDDIVFVVDFPEEPNYGSPEYNSPEWTDQFWVFVNNQSGGFDVGASLIETGLGNRNVNGTYRRYTMADFDGDGDCDLLACDYPISNFMTSSIAHDYRYLRVAKNRLGASDWDTRPLSDFDLWTRSSVDPEAFAMSYQIMPGDFNGDGKSDLAMHRKDGGTNVNKIIVYISGKNPFTFMDDFVEVRDWSPPIPVSGKLISGEFISGSMTDLVEVSNGLNEINILTNLMAPPYVADPRKQFGHAIDHLKYKPEYAFGDVNGDGYKDIIVFTADQRGTVEVLKNNQTNGFQRSDHIWLSDFANSFKAGNEKPLAGDVNGDGFEDLVLFVSDDASFISDDSIFPWGVFVALNDQSGHFNPPSRWASMMAVLSNERTPLVDDFDGDGTDDIGIVSTPSTTYLTVALSTGSGFGERYEHYDWIIPTYQIFENEVYRSCDMDGDNIADLCVIIADSNPFESYARIQSYRMDGEGGISRSVVEYASNYDGEISDHSWLQAGKFSGDKYADVAVHLTEEEQDESDGASIESWFSDEGNGQQLINPEPRYRSLRFDEETIGYCEDVDADGRDELILQRYGLGNTSMEFIVIDISQVDIDLYAQDINTGVTIATSPPSKIPGGTWQRTSAWQFYSDELIYNMQSLTSLVAVKIVNNGTDPASYKLISNQIQKDIYLDALFLVYPEVPNDMRERYIEMIYKSIGRFSDATDGNVRLKNIHLWRPDEPGGVEWWRDHKCDTRIDLFLEYDDEIICTGDDPGRACAREDCHMTLFMDNRAGVFVHEYGHFGFGLSDEYCEDGSDTVAECPGDTGDRTPSICPHSLMSSSSGREFCTHFNHQTLGLDGVEQEDPCWDDIPISNIPGIDLLPFTREVIKTPNPHNYSEEIFKRHFSFN